MQNNLKCLLFVFFFSLFVFHTHTHRIGWVVVERTGAWWEMKPIYRYGFPLFWHGWVLVIYIRRVKCRSLLQRAESFSQPIPFLRWPSLAFPWYRPHLTFFFFETFSVSHSRTFLQNFCPSLLCWSFFCPLFLSLSSRDDGGHKQHTSYSWLLPGAKHAGIVGRSYIGC